MRPAITARSSHIQRQTSDWLGRELHLDFNIVSKAVQARHQLALGQVGEVAAQHRRHFGLGNAHPSAGLAPRLVLPGVFPEIDLWRRALTIPGADPFASLADSLLSPDALGPELARGPFRLEELLAKQLAGDPEAAIAPLREALDKAAAARQAEAKFEAPRPARLLLAIDQAERLLIETEAGLAQRFCALLAALARHRVATVVMALRSDAYARFQSIDSLVALRDAGATLDLLPPTPSELEDMTTRPVALCEPPLVFEQKDGRSLAATLVADARGGDALPLLQMTLSRLGAAEAARGDGVLRFADYRGTDEAVTETANEALAGLDAAARGQAPDLIAGLVRDVAADPLTGAPTPVIGALDRARFEKRRPERTALVEAFVGKRLITAEGDAASQRVRPTHEALLRIWPEAVAIIAEAAHLIRVRHALEPIAREWAEADPEDKARHLDISPALLDGAERYVERFGAEASPATRDFVAAASAAAEVRRDRERREHERRLAGAESAYRDALAVARALTREQPRVAMFQLRLFAAAERLGILLANRGDRAGALDAYGAERDAAAALVSLDKTNANFADALHSSVGNVGAVAKMDLLAGDYAAALAALDKAAPVAPEQNWLDLIRAASLMFQGHADEARALYMKHRGEASYAGKSWEQATTEDFALLRANGQSEPLMDEIEALFAAPH